jgi:hypothetical protein
VQSLKGHLDESIIVFGLRYKGLNVSGDTIATRASGRPRPLGRPVAAGRLGGGVAEAGARPCPRWRACSASRASAPMGRRSGR